MRDALGAQAKADHIELAAETCLKAVFAAVDEDPRDVAVLLGAMMMKVFLAAPDDHTALLLARLFSDALTRGMAMSLTGVSRTPH